MLIFASTLTLSGCVANLKQLAPPAASFGGPFTAVAGIRHAFSAIPPAAGQDQALSYAWSFGDGATATGASPVHTYAMVGSVVVSLIVTEPGGPSSTTTATGAVDPGTPTANLGATYSATATFPVAFSGGASTDPQSETLTYAWSFGDGGSMAGVSPSHIYASPGSYIVSLTVTNTSNLSATASASVHVSAAPPIANAAGPYSGASGVPIAFSAAASSDPQGEPLAYWWNFGDGQGGPGGNASHTYSAPGQYNVSLTVTNTSNLSATDNTQTSIAAPSTGFVQGRVMAGLQPVSNSSVQLYAASTNGSGSASLPLLGAPVTTSASGDFVIAGANLCPSPNSQIYLAATGGSPGLTGGSPGLAGGGNNPSLALIAALGPCASTSLASAFITIDAVSTVAAVWPAAPYIASATQIGASDIRSLSNAFVDSANLSGIVSGTPAFPGIVIPGQDLAMRSLANALNFCVASDGDASPGSPCGVLFAAVTPAGGVSPANTLSAALAIALNPTANVPLLYSLGAANPAFQPSLAAPPSDWTLSLPQSPPPFFVSSLNHSTVFMGDSITQWWPLPVNNQGIAGQFAAQMLSRFATDILGHGYTRVVILAGTNDIWWSDPAVDHPIEQIAAMAQMARAAGIEPILCELPPMFLLGRLTTPPLMALNASITQLASTNGYLLVDYYTPMAGHPEYSLDGVHPNPAGYAVMEAALSSVIEQ